MRSPNTNNTNNAWNVNNNGNVNNNNVYNNANGVSPWFWLPNDFGSYKYWVQKELEGDALWIIRILFTYYSKYNYKPDFYFTKGE